MIVSRLFWSIFGRSRKNLKTTGKKEELCRRSAAALVLEAERGAENEDADEDECEDEQDGDEGITNEDDEEGEDDGDGDTDRRRVSKTNSSPQRTTTKPKPRREEANRAKTKVMNFSFRDIEDLMRPFEGHTEYPIEGLQEIFSYFGTPALLNDS
ncbi:UNVERIFIED_CONTAM: hypothetical protein PYX00_010806 [Menopon gallinae]|uniref:Uncharacterized protein n=1 Tax=Menopon gallinae TaxID=328185 RepID=A0AAW2HH02_9NEOP